MTNPKIPIPPEVVETLQEFIKERVSTWLTDDKARAAIAAALAVWPGAHKMGNGVPGGTKPLRLILPLAQEGE